jgi:hypothetical protein
MGIWRQIISGGRSYTDQEYSDGSHKVRRDDGFLRSTGTDLGETGSMKDSLDIVKSDSGAKDTTMKDL